MSKRATALVIAATLSLLNFGDKKPLGAQPLEIQPAAIHIPGPVIIVQRPLELSIDQRLAAEHILAECRLRAALKHETDVSQNTDIGSLRQNPLPGLSALLSDAYALIAQK